MKKFLKLYAVILIFTLISVFTAGCGSKAAPSGSQNGSETRLPVSQNNGSAPSGAMGESSSDTYPENGTEKNTEDTAERTASASDKTDVSEENGTTEGFTQHETKDTGGADRPQETQTPAPAQTQTSTPTQAQTAAQAPTQAPSQAPAQTQTPKPTQAQTSAQAPSAPAQTPASATLPITVSDTADAAAESIIVSITNSGMSEFDKVKAIHDYIVINVDYPSSIDMSNRSLFTAEGALVNRLAVCQGYAEAFSLLCYKAGIQTEVVYGTADNGQFTESHAWNIVRIDGSWYQIDTTWDDPIAQNTAGGANLRYSYFLIPDSVMSIDHTVDSYTHKYSCTDSKYIEYGELQTVAILVKQNFGDVKYDFASNDAEVSKIASSNSASGVKNYVVVYNMGQKIDESSVTAVNGKINDICRLIPQATENYSRISFQSLYQHGIKYVMVNAVIE